MGKGASAGDSSLNQKSESDTNSDLVLHEALMAAASKQVPERTPYFESNMEYPALNAMAARAAYFGVQGRLLPSLEQIQSAMQRSGPIGEAAVERMQNLSTLGWKFGPILPSDPYLLNSLTSVAGRFAKLFSLGGYNDSRSGKIAFNALGSMMNAISGISSGADVDVANKYIHELAHGKYSGGYQLYEATPASIEALRMLPAAAQVEHGTQMLQEELRAISAQSVANLNRQSPLNNLLPQTKGIANYYLESSLRQGETGRFVKDIWGYEGSNYLSSNEAAVAGRNYLQSNYGTIFQNGRVTPEAERAIAGEIKALALESPAALLNNEVLEASFSTPRYFKYLSKAGQGFAAVTALTTISDLRKQFSLSTGSGLGRVTSVGSDWAGFEGGLAAGTWIGEAATDVLTKMNPKLAMFALPLLSLGAGLFGAQVVHDKISQPLGLLTQREIDALLDSYKAR